MAEAVESVMNCILVQSRVGHELYTGANTSTCVLGPYYQDFALILGILALLSEIPIIALKSETNNSNDQSWWDVFKQNLDINTYLKIAIHPS